MSNQASGLVPGRPPRTRRRTPGLSKLSEGTTTSSFDSDHSTPVIAEEDGETTAAAAAAASSRPVAVRGVAAADAKFKEPPPALALPPWDAYFERRYYVPLSSAVSGDDQDVAQVYEVGSHGPLVVCVHGGGYSALSWALVARHLKSKEVRVAAFDLRGHGGTRAADEADLSMERLAADMVSVFNQIVDRHQEQEREGEEPLKALLVGHSLGGAVAVRAARTGELRNLCGLVVIDLVEGTAMAALPYMEGLIKGQPQGFASVRKGVEWCMTSGQCKNMEAACISFPPRIVPANRDSQDDSRHPGAVARHAYVWRTPLLPTKPFWREWYEGLSQHFLDCKVPKLLLLAGTDRLDKQLTIAQMQGKFQLCLMPQAGHAIQEDQPQKVADTLYSFLNRYRLLDGQTLDLPAVLPRGAATSVWP
mmetsp:Transcript_3293/g.11942  ORF Transcript_3293/g.11942 Transcript_3293/m.11942 type:complete len:420 (+) Transcript_3293:119-1378(+)